MIQHAAAIIVDGILLGLIYAIVGLGLSLILGIMGVVNVAHSAFIMLGSFLAFEMFRRLGVDPIVSFFVAIPVFFVLGAIVYRVIITRVERAAQTQGLVAMFGMMVLIENLGTIAWTTDTRVITAAYTNSFRGVGGLVLAHVRLIAGLLALVLIGVFWAFFRFTLTGRAIRAMGQDRTQQARRNQQPATVGSDVRSWHCLRRGRRSGPRDGVSVLSKHPGAMACLGVSRRHPRRAGKSREYARGRSSGRPHPDDLHGIHAVRLRLPCPLRDARRHPDSAPRGLKPRSSPGDLGGARVLGFPDTQRRQGQNKAGYLVLAFWLAIVAGLVLYGAFGRQLFILSTLGTVFLYVVLTQSWNILGGYGGYLNFGMVTFFGVGAYTSAIMFHYYGLSPFLTAPLAGLAAALLGLMIGIPTLRLRGAYFALVTMIITFAVQILALNADITQGALGIYLPRLPLTPLGVERLFYFLFLALAVLVTALVYAIQYSNVGWALVAIREDEDAAEIVGVRTIEVKWAANAVACFIAGIVGGLYAQRIAYIEPTGTFSFDISLNVVLMAVIGGAGTWQGPLIGAPLVLLVADALRVTFTSEVNRVIFSLVVILIALFVPGGVMGVLQGWRKSGRRKQIDPTASSEPVATCCDRIRSAARSATMIVGRLVLALGTLGITDASTTRRFRTP